MHGLAGLILSVTGRALQNKPELGGRTIGALEGGGLGGVGPTHFLVGVGVLTHQYQFAGLGQGRCHLLIIPRHGRIRVVKVYLTR